MEEVISASIKDHFPSIPDPRIEGKTRRGLLDIIVITICGVTSGADPWTGIETYGRARYEWLKGFWGLANGIASHDTISRVFSILSPEVFILNIVESKCCIRDTTNTVIVHPPTGR